MKPVTLKIFNSITDSFFYMGKLFLLTTDRRFRYINNEDLLQYYIKERSPIANEYLSRIFFGNDTLPTAKHYFDKISIKKPFDDFWLPMSNSNIEFTIREEHLTSICDLPEQEALDFYIYAERAYLANRSGLYECQLHINNRDVLARNGGFKKIFDSKSININPRAGKVLVSTKSDGLFAGSIDGIGLDTVVGKKAISEHSVRTDWADYNFVNYSTQVEGDFYLNETQEQGQDGVNFTLEDGVKKNMKISEIAIEHTTLDSFYADGFRDEEIIFKFNSLSISFNVGSSGNIYYGRFANQENGINSAIELSPLQNLKFDIKKLGYPLSARTVNSGGTVYEFFDQVILVKKGRMEVISNVECKQIRTFASSRWFKNILMTLSENSLEIHSVHPYL